MLNKSGKAAVRKAVRGPGDPSRLGDRGGEVGRRARSGAGEGSLLFLVRCSC